MSKEIINVQMDKEYYEKVINNVPQEGGGSGGNEDGGNKIAYLKMSSDVDSNLRLQAFVLCANARIVAEGSVGYSSAGLISYQGGNIQNYATIVDALAIEQNGKCVQSNGKYVILMSDIIAQLEQSGCTRITEEEFYNTEA